MYYKSYLVETVFCDPEQKCEKAVSRGGIVPGVLITVTSTLEIQDGVELT